MRGWVAAIAGLLIGLADCAASQVPSPRQEAIRIRQVCAAQWREGRLPTRVEEVRCANERIRSLYLDSGYPHMAQLDAVLARSLALAQRIDAGSISPDEAAREGAAVAARAPDETARAALWVPRGEGPATSRGSVGAVRNALGVLLVTRVDGSSVRLQGKEDLQLFEGDELKTGPGTRALIELADGTRVALNEQTTSLLRSRRDEGTGLGHVLRLPLGELWVKTAARPRPLEIETPVGGAATRGTQLNMKVLADGRSILTVMEGLVDFGTAFGSCPVRAGTQSTAERGKGCSPPTPVSPDPVIGWTAPVLR